jgi:hypothetical protein
VKIFGQGPPRSLVAPEPDGTYALKEPDLSTILFVAGGLSDRPTPTLARERSRLPQFNIGHDESIDTAVRVVPNLGSCLNVTVASTNRGPLLFYSPYATDEVFSRREKFGK